MKQGLANTASNTDLVAIQIIWHVFVITSSSAVNNRCHRLCMFFPKVLLGNQPIAYLLILVLQHAFLFKFAVIKNSLLLFIIIFFQSEE